MYVSRCALSATEMGVFGQAGYGHVDDYYSGAPFGVLYDPFPLNSHLDPCHTANRIPHADNCIADYMTTSIYYYRGRGDGDSAFRFMSTSPPLGDWGAKYRWQPVIEYPVPNVSPPSTHGVEATWGLAQYVSQYAGYHCKHTSWTYDGNTYGYDDIADFYNQSILGYRGTGGVVPQDIIDEIDAGRPVIAIMNGLDSSNVETGNGHAFAAFGYRRIVDGGQPSIDMLVYDTWNDDFRIDPNTGLPYESTCYRVVKFPNPQEAPHRDPPQQATGYFWRAAKNMGDKIYGFGFLKINDNDRCPDALAATDYPSGEYTDEFDISFQLGDNSSVHYEYGTKDPHAGSDSITLDANGEGTFHVDHSCCVNFRTYRDATPPDGYLASRVVRRVYYTQPKKSADNDSVRLVSMAVTHVVDEDTFYAEQKETRAFGVRVHKEGHGLAVGDWLDTLDGTMETISDGERYVEATAVAVSASRRGLIRPLGMQNRTLGGGDWNYDDQTGEGQHGVNGGAGLNSIGLLVRTTGCVCTSDTSTFSITDGSGDPVDVVVPESVTPPDVDTHVGVTAVCSCESDGASGLLPLLLVRSQDDIIEYGDCEAAAIQAQPPAQSRPTGPVIEPTDTVAWALKQSDSTSVGVNACSVLASSSNGLTISDGWTSSAATIRVSGNWAVDQWSTVDITGTLTTLSGGPRAITATQVLVYTDSRGRPLTFPMLWRTRAGQLVDDWPYKQAASLR